MHFGARRQVLRRVGDLLCAVAHAERPLAHRGKRRAEFLDRRVEVSLDLDELAFQRLVDPRRQVAASESRQLPGKHGDHRRLLRGQIRLQGLPFLDLAPFVVLGAARRIRRALGGDQRRLGAALGFRRAGDGAEDHRRHPDRSARFGEQNNRMQHHAHERASARVDRLRQQIVEGQVMDRDRRRRREDRDRIAIDGDQREAGKIAHMEIGLPGAAGGSADHQRHHSHQRHRDRRAGDDGAGPSPRDCRGDGDRRAGAADHFPRRVEVERRGEVERNVKPHQRDQHQTRPTAHALQFDHRLAPGSCLEMQNEKREPSTTNSAPDSLRRAPVPGAAPDTATMNGNRPKPAPGPTEAAAASARSADHQGGKIAASRAASEGRTLASAAVMRLPAKTRASGVQAARLRNRAFIRTDRAPRGARPPAPGLHDRRRRKLHSS